MCRHVHQLLFSSFPMLIFAELKCEQTNIKLIPFSGGKNISFCRKVCGGRLAVPNTSQEYGCVTKGFNGTRRYETPTWTAIGVRPGGGLYDPRTNQTVETYDKKIPEHYKPPLTSYITLRVPWRLKVPYNSIYLHNSFYVEVDSLYPVQNGACACEQGKQLATTLNIPELFPVI